VPYLTSAIITSMLTTEPDTQIQVWAYQFVSGAPVDGLLSVACCAKQIPDTNVNNKSAPLRFKNADFSKFFIRIVLCRTSFEEPIANTGFSLSFYSTSNIPDFGKTDSRLVCLPAKKKTAIRASKPPMPHIIHEYPDEAAI
jgi:hypothetical protein